MCLLRNDIISVNILCFYTETPMPRLPLQITWSKHEMFDPPPKSTSRQVMLSFDADFTLTHIPNTMGRNEHHRTGGSNTTNIKQHLTALRMIEHK